MRSATVKINLDLQEAMSQVEAFKAQLEALNAKEAGMGASVTPASGYGGGTPPPPTATGRGNPGPPYDPYQTPSTASNPYFGDEEVARALAGMGINPAYINRITGLAGDTPSSVPPPTPAVVSYTTPGPSFIDNTPTPVPGEGNTRSPASTLETIAEKLEPLEEIRDTLREGKQRSQSAGMEGGEDSVASGFLASFLGAYRGEVSSQRVRGSRLAGHIQNAMLSLLGGGGSGGGVSGGGDLEETPETGGGGGREGMGGIGAVLGKLMGVAAGPAALAAVGYALIAGTSRTYNQGLRQGYVGGWDIAANFVAGIPGLSALAPGMQETQVQQFLERAQTVDAGGQVPPVGQGWFYEFLTGKGAQGQAMRGVETLAHVMPGSVAGMRPTMSAWLPTMGPMYQPFMSAMAQYVGMPGLMGTGSGALGLDPMMETLRTGSFNGRDAFTLAMMAGLRGDMGGSLDIMRGGSVMPMLDQNRLVSVAGINPRGDISAGAGIGDLYQAELGNTLLPTRNYAATTRAIPARLLPGLLAYTQQYEEIRSGTLETMAGTAGAYRTELGIYGEGSEDPRSLTQVGAENIYLQDQIKIQQTREQRMRDLQKINPGGTAEYQRELIRAQAQRQQLENRQAELMLSSVQYTPSSALQQQLGGAEYTLSLYGMAPFDVGPQGRYAALEQQYQGVGQEQAAAAQQWSYIQGQQGGTLSPAQQYSAQSQQWQFDLRRRQAELGMVQYQPTFQRAEALSKLQFYQQASGVLPFYGGAIAQASLAQQELQEIGGARGDYLATIAQYEQTHGPLSEQEQRAVNEQMRSFGMREIGLLGQLSQNLPGRILGGLEFGTPEFASSMIPARTLRGLVGLADRSNPLMNLIQGSTVGFQNTRQLDSFLGLTTGLMATATAGAETFEPGHPGNVLRHLEGTIDHLDQKLNHLAGTVNNVSNRIEGGFPGAGAGNTQGFSEDWRKR